MGKVIVVTSGKGGVGKTTSTAALGAALRALERLVAVVGMRRARLRARQHDEQRLDQKE